MRTVAFEKPYLIVFHTQDKWQHGWFTGPDAAQFIKLRSNPKRLERDDNGVPVVDPDHGDVIRLDAELIPAIMYKIEIVGNYDTLSEIYRSFKSEFHDCTGKSRSMELMKKQDELYQPAKNFLDGESMADLLWEIEW